MFRVEAKGGSVVRTYKNVDPSDVNTSESYNYDVETWDEYQQLVTRPNPTITADSDTIVNDGSNTVSVTVGVTGVREFDPDSFDIVLCIVDSEFAGTVTESDNYTEELTTTANAGTIIECDATGDNVRNSETIEIEVVSA